MTLLHRCLADPDRTHRSIPHSLPAHAACLTPAAAPPVAGRQPWLHCLCLLALLLCWLPLATAQAASAFAKELPADISTAADLCSYAPCREVLPEANSFSTRLGKPYYVEGYALAGDSKRLVGYVFLSSDIVDIPGYSGKPIHTLIGLKPDGIISGVKILKHSEPLLLSGIPEQVLIDFVNQYVGKNIADKIEIGESRPAEGVVGLDAISAATVTVIAQNQIVTLSALGIAKQLGIVTSVQRPAVKLAPSTNARYDWPTLLQQGALGHLLIERNVVGLPATGEPYMDLYFAYLNAPDLGRSLLGDVGHENLMSRLKKNEHAILVMGRGALSFKGEGFVHGGIFDRLLVGQDLDSFSFRDIDSLTLDHFAAAGAPPWSEAAIFILRSSNFSPAYPWRLIFRADKYDSRSGGKVFTNFEQSYWLPALYQDGGRPSYTPPDPTWLRIWQGQPVKIALFALFLLATGLTYAYRDELARRASHRDKRWINVPKYAIWLCAIFFVGFTLLAQPSITQVLTLLHALLFKWEWPLFLSDPFIFLFWWFIMLSIVLWGRGLFCGWLCPYGTLSELLFKLAGKLGLKRWQFLLPGLWHERLKWLKYAIFLVLVLASFHSMELAEVLAEVEPFKTTFLVGVWNRSWPFVLFWTLLIVASAFTERPFCKYLCPLGASLAIPSTFRWFGLKRKQECGACRACEHGCESQAIDRAGRIDQRECLACMDCVILYYDDHGCPPLAKERKRRQKTGQPLTRVASNGYFIPITPLPAATPRHHASMPEAPARLSPAGWLKAELLDLFPWQRPDSRGQAALIAAGLILAALVSWIWLLYAAGHLEPMVVLGWWSLWSGHEAWARMAFKPQIPEGPWWQRRMRRASWADMAAYVGLKNILIAALLLYLISHDSRLGLLLQDLPDPGWFGSSLALT